MISRRDDEELRPSVLSGRSVQTHRDFSEVPLVVNRLGTRRRRPAVASADDGKDADGAVILQQLGSGSRGGRASLVAAPSVAAPSYVAPSPVEEMETLLRSVAPAVAPSATRWGAVAHRVLVASAAGDVLVAVGSVWIAVAVVSFAKGHDMLVHTSALASALAAALWGTVVLLLGGYGVRRPGFRGGAFRESIFGSIALFLLLASLRGVWGVGLPVAAIFFASFLALVGGLSQRLFVRRLIRNRRRRGFWLTRALVVSSSPRAHQLVARLVQRTGHGMLVEGLCSDSDPGVCGVALLGRVDQACEVARRLAVDSVIIDCDELQPDDLRDLLWQLEQYGLAAVIAPPMGEIDPSRLSLLPTMDATLLGVQLGGQRSSWIVKTMFDRVLGTGLLLAASPMLLVLALAVALTSKGPVFFRQVRVGRQGQLFNMWKFRSMYPDAEARKAALEAESEGAGLLFKMKNDPRVTPVGRILRRFSLDELPQLFNVVTGEMALVGPRPALPREADEYDWSVYQRLKVRPGMTGLWQVSGRSDLSWEESVRLDLRYADNWSIRMDLKILAATVGAVLGGKGAY